MELNREWKKHSAVHEKSRVVGYFGVKGGRSRYNCYI